MLLCRNTFGALVARRRCDTPACESAALTRSKQSKKQKLNKLKQKLKQESAIQGPSPRFLPEDCSSDSDIEHVECAPALEPAYSNCIKLDVS